MKNLVLVFSLLFLVSCSVEEPMREYTTAIRNTSNQPLHVLILGDTIGRNHPVYDTLVNTTLNTGESYNRKYKHESFSGLDRKSTRLNSSHVKISYAVSCLQRKGESP